MILNNQAGYLLLVKSLKVSLQRKNLDSLFILLVFCFIEIIVSLFLGKQFGKKQKSIISLICTVKIYSAVKCSLIHFLYKRDLLCGSSKYYS